ncbi:MAG: tyrosine-type recombinase/integrase [Steroidobacteraceae bacterium]
MTQKSTKLKLTKSVVDALPSPVKGQAIYRDSDLTGLALRITSGGAKTFVVEKRINGHTRRIKLGRLGDLTPELARRKAQQILGEIAMGADPVAKKQESALKAVTLQVAFNCFLELRRNLKPRTVLDYKRHMKVTFADWKDKSLLSITPEMVIRRHTTIGARSQSQANQAMRFLRALLNFASANYVLTDGTSLLTQNPVTRLSKTRAWYRLRRRNTVITVGQLPVWFEAVTNYTYENSPRYAETTRDYLLFLLFTGLRRTEAAQLKWENVDLQARTITLHDTKNREDHTLPLPNYLFDMIKKRHGVAIGNYVFEGRDGKGIDAPTKHIRRIKNLSGVNFSLHDLRRTFATTAERLDLSGYAIKRLLNHKMNNDVTAGYIVNDVERLRKPMQEIEDGLLEFVSSPRSEPLRAAA